MNWVPSAQMPQVCRKRRSLSRSKVSMGRQSEHRPGLGNLRSAGVVKRCSFFRPASHELGCARGCARTQFSGMRDSTKFSVSLVEKDDPE